jgi:hypothetical protein
MTDYGTLIANGMLTGLITFTLFLSSVLIYDFIMSVLTDPNSVAETATSTVTAVLHSVLLIIVMLLIVFIVGTSIYLVGQWLLEVLV